MSARASGASGDTVSALPSTGNGNFGSPYTFPVGNGPAAVAAGAELGLPDAATVRILTVFEEIFTNTVKYGYRDRPAGAPPASVHVTLAGPPARLLVPPEITKIILVAA